MEENKYKERELERLFNELYSLGFSLDNTSLNKWIANKDNLRVIIEWSN